MGEGAGVGQGEYPRGAHEWVAECGPECGLEGERGHGGGGGGVAVLLGAECGGVDCVTQGTEF